MPEVNFNLLNPGAELYSGPQVTLDPVKAYETAQAKQQSNMLAQLYAKHYDPQTGGVNYNSLIGEAAQSGLGKYIPDIMGEAQKQSQSMAEIAQKRAIEEKNRQEMFDAGVKSSMTYSRSQLDNITTPEEYLKWHEANHADPYLSQYFAAHNINKEDRRAEINSLLSQEGGLKTLIEQSKKGFDSILGVKPVEQKQFQPTAAEVEYNLWKSDPAAYERFKRAQEGPKAGAAATTTGTKPLTQLQQNQLNTQKTLGVSGIDAAKTTADELEKLTDELVGNPDKKMPPHKGLKGITGANAFIKSFPEYEIAGIKITSGDASKAEQKLETFKGKILAFGRALATQYGKLGNMAVQEWKMVADSIQSIKPESGNLDEQMRDVVRQARAFEQSLRDKYIMEYGEEPKSAAAPAAATPSAAGKTGKTKSGVTYTVEPG